MVPYQPSKNVAGYRSGQTGQTVNLLDYSFEGSNPSPATILFCVDMGFEWNQEKKRGNILKHGVSFHEAAIVFGDSVSWTFPDPDHTIREKRF